MKPRLMLVVVVSSYPIAPSVIVWVCQAFHDPPKGVNMGFFPDLYAGKPNILADPTGRTGMTGFRRARASASRSSLSVCSHRAISQKP